MATERNEDMLLSLYYPNNGCCSVEAWAVEPPPANNLSNYRPLDSEFCVQVLYNNRCDGWSKNMLFRLETEKVDMENPRDWYPVNEWLDALGVDHSTAYGASIDVIGDAFEEMVDQVRTRGRRSLAIMVEIVLFSEDIDDDDQMEVNDVFDDGEIQYVNDDDIIVDDDDVVVLDVDKEVEEEVIKDALVASGVKFTTSATRACLGDTTCSICLEDTAATTTNGGDSKVEVAVLPCSHNLHAGCIVSWVTKGAPTCPSCRFEFPAFLWSK